MNNISYILLTTAREKSSRTFSSDSPETPETISVAASLINGISNSYYK